MHVRTAYGAPCARGPAPTIPHPTPPTCSGACAALVAAIGSYMVIVIAPMVTMMSSSSPSSSSTKENFAGPRPLPALGAGLVGPPEGTELLSAPCHRPVTDATEARRPARAGRQARQGQGRGAGQQWQCEIAQWLGLVPRHTTPGPYLRAGAHRQQHTLQNTVFFSTTAVLPTALLRRGRNPGQSVSSTSPAKRHGCPCSCLPTMWLPALKLWPPRWST